jgi:hypothetical protein
VSPSKLIRAGSGILALAADAVEGKVPSPAEIVAVLFGAASGLGVTDELREFLTQEARARVDAEIDAKIERGG